MKLDNDNYAWFSLAGTDKNSDYFVGMDVEKIITENAVIPETMYQEYALEEEMLQSRSLISLLR